MKNYNLTSQLAHIQGKLEGYAEGIFFSPMEVNWENLIDGLTEQAKKLEEIRKKLEKEPKT